MLKQQLKKIYQAVFKPHQVIGLEYPLLQKSNYSAAKPHQQLLKVIVVNHANYQQLLTNALLLKEDFANIPIQQQHSILPYWQNNFFPGLDIVVLYTLLHTYQPKQYVEIGCGTSTKVAKLYQQKYHFQLHITCIDPAPRQEVIAVADDWINKSIQEVDLAVIKSLQANDILFFDGSHLLLPNSDVMWFFMEILPIVPKGVLIQIHDVYLPYDYPDFMIERSYNEQYILATYLLANAEKIEIISPNFYISQNKELTAIVQPIWALPTLKNVEQHGGSFWFKIK